MTKKVAMLNCHVKGDVMTPENIWTLSVTWSFRNLSNMLICCSRNISYYYQCWKQCCFLWKPFKSLVWAKV